MTALAQDYNVLFIVSDQHRRDTAGCYGHPLARTPHLDRLATSGVRFNGAYCQAPLCGPSRSSIITGTQVHTCGAFTHWQEASLPDMPTLGSVFRQGGYITGAIGKLHVKGETRKRDLGFDDRQMRYYTYHYEDYINAVGPKNVNEYNCYLSKDGPYPRDVYNAANEPIRMDERMMYDAVVSDQVIDFITRHRKDRFFLWAGLEKPHPDWYAPAEYHRMYDPAGMSLPATLRDTEPSIPRATLQHLREAHKRSDADVRGCLAAYYANVTYLDAKIGQILTSLEVLGLRERTIIVYTSDHGELLFDHGMLQKHCFYEGAVGVPLVMSLPGVLPSAAVRDHVVSLVDLFPTLTHLTGVPTPAGLEGESLADVLNGQAPLEGREAFSEFYSWGVPERMIRTGRWKYILTIDDVDQLYDLENDPLERSNLAEESSCQEIRRQLCQRVRDDWEIPSVEMLRRP